ncbi:hypothetical protein SAMN05192532_103249 [Alteribacillus iranensis]|uniref:Uncharacterized protein n=1 Tax=Alteribacillus iranensis TaxID=930128 RepID=A0A1I2CWC7_9BACI|nr:hypothetical protein SAMN05192532_103249 [Alteribacillus iranensis]
MVREDCLSGETSRQSFFHDLFILNTFLSWSDTACFPIVLLFREEGTRTSKKQGREEGQMLWTIIIILVVLWLIGLIFEIAGGLINLLLIAALIILIYRFFANRKR